VLCVVSDHDFTRVDHNLNLLSAFVVERLVMRKRDSTWLNSRKMATVAKSEYDRGSCNADKARLQTKRLGSPSSAM
jgi:hypothetical protein